MKNKSPFGEKLRELRQECGMSLATVADAANFSIVHMSDIERGKKNPPEASKIQAILNELNMPEMLHEMLVLATLSRQSIEISVDAKNEEVADMLVALARRCDADDLDPKMIEQIRKLIEKGVKE